jgi:Mn-dependent DtxR family transcriptional regulator
MKQKLLESNRTPLDEACEQIIRRLSEEQKPYSITGLAKESQLHRKTVEKAINLLVNLEQKGLDNFRLKVLTVDNRKIITLESRTGLLSYPEDIQRLIIKARHFPFPTEEAYTLLYLYLNDAISPKSALPMEGKKEMLRKLLTQGQIKEKNESHYYLTEEGIIIAKGTLRIFPDLEKHRNSKNARTGHKKQ